MTSRKRGFTFHLASGGVGALTTAYVVAAPLGGDSPVNAVFQGRWNDALVQLGNRVVPFPVPGLSSGNAAFWGPTWGGYILAGLLRWARRKRILPTIKIADGLFLT